MGDYVLEDVYIIGQVDELVGEHIFRLVGVPVNRVVSALHHQGASKKIAACRVACSPKVQRSIESPRLWSKRLNLHCCSCAYARPN